MEEHDQAGVLPEQHKDIKLTTQCPNQLNQLPLSTGAVRPQHRMQLNQLLP